VTSHPAPALLPSPEELRFEFLEESSAPGRPTVWRLLETPPASGSYNMAVDEALMASVRAGGGPFLRLYSWSPPCISLGRNQPASGQYDVGALHAAGLDIVRRPTGGRAVLHHHQLTYSVVARERAFRSPRRAYSTINQILVAALRCIGVEAEVRPDGLDRSPPPSLRPCFADPVAGEVVSRGRKLIGSAQVTFDGVLLQHGSISLAPSPLLDVLPPLVAASFDGGGAYVDLLVKTDAHHLKGAIAEQWTRSAGALVRGSLEREVDVMVQQLLPQYRSDAWTWRR
jgi:lipoyl(octanoyl) transferase